MYKNKEQWRIQTWLVYTNWVFINNGITYSIKDWIEKFWEKARRVLRQSSRLNVLDQDVYDYVDNTYKIRSEYE